MFQFSKFRVLTQLQINEGHYIKFLIGSRSLHWSMMTHPSCSVVIIKLCLLLFSQKSSVLPSHIKKPKD